MTTGITRRDTLRIGALLGFCGAFPYVANAIGPGLPVRGDRESIYQVTYPLSDPRGMVSTTCGGCLGACSLRAHREVGVLAKLDGNPFSARQLGDPEPHDLTHAAELRGASCARGQARIQNVHDPYRLVRPLVRDGARGEGRYRTVDEAAALAAVLDGDGDRPGLRAIHDAALGQPAGEPPVVVIAVDTRSQDRRPALSAFTAAFEGSAALLGHPAAGHAAATAAVLGTPGWLAVPRWERARAIVGWGANPIAGGIDPIRASWWVAEARSKHRAQVVSIDPRLSDVGNMSDLWVPVRPGGDRALAHWIAKIWAETGVVPEDAVPPSLRAWPERHLEHETGLGPRIARRLAETMADAGPALALAIGGGVTDHPGGGDTAVAILRLAALAGAMAPGGAMEPFADPIPALDGPRALLDALTGRQPPQAVLLVGDAGIQDTPWERPVLEALATVPIVIAVTTAMNRVAWHADIVLPDVTEHERVGLCKRHDGTSVTLPAIPPVPREAGLSGPLGLGLEGVLHALTTGVGREMDIRGAVWSRIATAARETPVPSLPPDDIDLVVGNLQTAVPDMPEVDPAVGAFLGRGWAPAWPSTPPPPTAWAHGPDTEAVESHPDEPTLVTYRESFGGQSDSDAQSWGARAVRSTNPVQAHPETLHHIEGEHSDRILVGDEIGEVEATQAVRPGVVALAIGWGQRHGFDGEMVIDGVTVPAAPNRCAGIAVGRILHPTRGVELAWGPERADPTVWDLLKPGGHQQLPSVLRKHHEDV